MRDWWNHLADTLSQVATVVGVVVTMGATWVIIWTWVTTWDWVQKGIVIFIGVLLTFLLVLSVYAWWRKNQIYQIPKLLYKMDSILREFVDQFEPLKVPIADTKGFLDDLSELMHIAYYPLANAYQKKDKKAIASQTTRFNKAMPIDPKDTTENLKRMMQISALMNQHNIGLSKIKNTPQYKQLSEKVAMLEKIQPNPYVSIAIDKYLRQSDGWYSQLMGMKYITSQPEVWQLSPAEYRAAWSEPLKLDTRG